MMTTEGMQDRESPWTCHCSTSHSGGSGQYFGAKEVQWEATTLLKEVLRLQVLGQHFTLSSLYPLTTSMKKGV